MTTKRATIARRTRWVALFAVALSCSLAGARAVHAHSPSIAAATAAPNPSRFAYRLGAGPAFYKNAFHLQGQDHVSASTGGLSGYAFIGRTLSPYAATGVALRLSLSLPFNEDIPLYGNDLENVGFINGALLWQSDVDVSAIFALRLGAGLGYARLVESSGELLETNAFGVEVLAGLPIELWRYGLDARRTRLVPTFTLARSVSGSDSRGAFEGASTFGVSLMLEVSYDTQYATKPAKASAK